MEILSVNSISKGFGEKKVLDDVSLSLQKGELISLLGVSGAGKTTLFKCISGILTADSGSILLNGNNITGKPGQVSYMLQKDMLLEYKKIIDNVSLPLLISGMSKKAARKEAQKHFEEFGIAGTENMYPGELSGGMRQRAALLRTYLASGGVALLDEPFSALDTITKSQMHKWYLSVMEKIDLSTRILILSGSPGKITHEIIIEEKHPRVNDFNLTPEFINYKKQVIEALGTI